MRRIIFILTILTAVCFTACKKFVDVGPPATQLIASTAFNSDATATAAQLAVYGQMENNGLAYSLVVNTGMAADELTNYSSSTQYIDMATNNLTTDNALVSSLWTNLHKNIYYVNAVLEGLAKSTKISDVVKKQLIGEARFVRAFCHFYLVNLFGDIPLIQSTDYLVNSQVSRSSVADAYNFIIEDMQEAITLLSPNYLSGSNSTTTERVRPNNLAASALLARIYLYLGRWQEAANESSRVIASSLYSLSANLNNTFLKSSTEAIWQWSAIPPRVNTYPGAFLILTTTPSPVALDTAFIKGFQATDNRRSAWTKSITVAGKTYYFPYKYKMGQNTTTNTEYTMVLRLSEQYLIRAEARAMQNDLANGLNDLNIIRNRAGLSSLPGLSKAALVDSIQQERKFELFTEFADRWLNLKRTGTATNVLGPIKGSNWNATDQLYPIPQSEINLNRNLTQNPGY